jgi:hypothetical protein
MKILSAPGLAALLAAGSLVPATAVAQGPDRDGDRYERSDRDRPARGERARPERERGDFRRAPERDFRGVPRDLRGSTSVRRPCDSEARNGRPRRPQRTIRGAA